MVLVLEPSKKKSDIKIKQHRTKTVTTSSHKRLVFQKVHLVTDRDRIESEDKSNFQSQLCSIFRR